MDRTRLTVLTCLGLALVYLVLMGAWLWHRYRVERAHVRWSFEAGPLQHVQHGVGDDGTVVLCASTEVIALRPNGSERWRSHYSGYSPWVCYEPVPGGGVIICQTAYDYSSQSTALTGSMYLISTDGLIEWEQPFDFDGNFQGNNVTAELSLFLDGRMLAAHSLRDGRRAWTLETGGTHPDIWPQVDPAGNVYITTLGSELVAVSPAGEVKWRTAIEDCAPALPAVSGAGVIYLATLYGELIAVGEDGEVRWQRQLLGEFASGAGYGFQPSLAVNSSGTVAVVFGASALYVLAINGAEKYRYRDLQGRPMPPAIADDGTVYLQDFGGVTAIGPDGSVLWCNESLGAVGSCQPQLGPDGTLYVMYDEQLYALDP